MPSHVVRKYIRLPDLDGRAIQSFRCFFFLDTSREEAVALSVKDFPISGGGTGRKKQGAIKGGLNGHWARQAVPKQPFGSVPSAYRSGRLPRCPRQKKKRRRTYPKSTGYNAQAQSTAKSLTVYCGSGSSGYKVFRCRVFTGCAAPKISQRLLRWLRWPLLWWRLRCRPAEKHHVTFHRSDREPCNAPVLCPKHTTPGGPERCLAQVQGFYRAYAPKHDDSLGCPRLVTGPE